MPHPNPVAPRASFCERLLFYIIVVNLVQCLYQVVVGKVKNKQTAKLVATVLLLFVSILYLCYLLGSLGSQVFKLAKSKLIFRPRSPPCGNKRLLHLQARVRGCVVLWGRASGLRGAWVIPGAMWTAFLTFLSSEQGTRLREALISSKEENAKRDLFRQTFLKSRGGNAAKASVYFRAAAVGALVERTGGVAVVMMHGRNGSFSGRGQRLAKLALLMNAPVFCFDYRGYEKPGSTPCFGGNIWPTPRTATDDCLSVLRWASDKTRVPPGRTVVWGESLGHALAHEAIAARLAGAPADERPSLMPRLVVAHGGLYRARDLAPKVLRWCMPELDCHLTQHRCRELCGRVVDVVAFHSPEDRVVPVRCATNFAQEFPENTQLWQYQGSHSQFDYDLARLAL